MKSACTFALTAAIILLVACQPSGATGVAYPSVEQGVSSTNRQSAATTEGSAVGSADMAPSVNEPTAPQVASNPFAPLPQAPNYTVDDLRAAHPVQGEGSSCSIDHQCDSPLRCIAGSCGWPAAMTGDFDSGTPAVVFYPSGGRPDRMYMLETAITPLEQQRGLMHRRAMVSNGGMVFINDSEEQRNFWMRNTYLPLDIIFVRATGVIDSIQADCPPRSDALEPSSGPAQYIIELHAGQAADMGIQPGDRVELLNLPAP